MARYSELPRALRRAADRPAIPRRPPKPGSRLDEAAKAGTVTRSNTRPGTQGRQAADRWYRARRQLDHPDLPAREALGHRVAASRPRVVTFFAADPPRAVRVEGEGVSLTDVHRGATYMGAVGALVNDRYRTPAQVHLTGAAADRHFSMRFERWAPIAGLPVLADPDAARELADRMRTAEREPIFDSGRSRPGRRRRR